MFIEQGLLRLFYTKNFFKNFERAIFHLYCHRDCLNLVFLEHTRLQVWKLWTKKLHQIALYRLPNIKILTHKNFTILAWRSQDFAFRNFVPTLSLSTSWAISKLNIETVRFKLNNRFCYSFIAQMIIKYLERLNCKSKKCHVHNYITLHYTTLH